MRTVDVDNTLVYPPVPGDDRKQFSNATFAVRRCSRDRIAVGVRGDIDAVNGRELARYVVHHTRASRQLVLDLRPVDFFGLFTIPMLPVGENKDLAGTIFDAHKTAGTIMIYLIGLHILGALKHTFIDKDLGIFRMLPFGGKARE